MGSLLFLFFLVLAIVWGFSTYSEKSAVWEKEAQLAKKNKETLQLFEENTSGLGMAMDHQYNLYRSEVYIDEEKDAFAYISRYHVQWVYEDGKK